MCTAEIALQSDAAAALNMEDGKEALKKLRENSKDIHQATLRVLQSPTYRVNLRMLIWANIQLRERYLTNLDDMSKDGSTTATWHAKRASNELLTMDVSHLLAVLVDLPVLEEIGISSDYMVPMRDCLLETGHELKRQCVDAQRFMHLIGHFLAQHIWVELAYSELPPDAFAALIHPNQSAVRSKLADLMVTNKTIYQAETHVLDKGEGWPAVKTLLGNLHFSRMPYVREMFMELILSSYSVDDPHFPCVQEYLTKTWSTVRHTKTAAEDIFAHLKDCVRSSKRRTMIMPRVMSQVGGIMQNSYVGTSINSVDLKGHNRVYDND